MEIIIIAGPNGSGKSTLASQLGLKCDFISADKCEKDLLAHILDKDERELKATIYVAKAIMAAISTNQSCAFETVFSTEQMPEFLKNAKRQGYKISLHFVATETPEINIRRVAQRVKQGGHDVPREKIISRYEKTMKILPLLIEFVDEAIIYDNSKDKIRAFMVKENNQIKIISDIPNWAIDLPQY